MGLTMINDFDDIAEAIADVIDRTPPLLRNKRLFYAAAETAFFNYECKNRHNTRDRISERVKNGIALLNNL